jgi:DNA-directed RNA polymerase specialized sigma24 family protein
MDEETTVGGIKNTFQTTLWTIVLKAKDHGASDRREALGLLIETYWKPAYFFIRRRGHDVESAKDLAQSFFTALLEKDFLKTVTPERGRFRSFLMAALTHFLSDQYDRANARKRGGGFAFVQAERDLAAIEAGPEKAFFKQWALETMSRAITRLREESSPDDFALLMGERPKGPSSSDVKNRIRRLRQRLNELLREIIRPSVELESDIDAEVDDLFSKPL